MNKTLSGHDMGFGDPPKREQELSPPNPKKKGRKRCAPANEETVDHPNHYRGNTGIEAINVIEAWGLEFNDGNAVKYISRHKHKKNPIQDIEKAIWYLNRHLVNLKSKELQNG